MRTKTINIIFLFVAIVTMSSCVDLKQVTHLNKDGSGVVTLYYSTKLSNLSMGDELGDFAFSEIKARNFLTSANSDVRELKIETKDSDSTVYVSAIVNFKDFNKLNSAKSFSKVQTLWEKTSEGFKFAFVIDKDSVKLSNFGDGKHMLVYEFDFPGDVITSNGKNSGKKASWTFELSQLKSGINMTATVKSDSGICGMFGLELPIIILLAGLVFLTLRNIKKRDS
jgi:hypothetical protein